MNRNTLFAIAGLLLILLVVLGYRRSGSDRSEVSADPKLAEAIDRLNDGQARMAERLDRLEMLYGRSPTALPSALPTTAAGARNYSGTAGSSGVIAGVDRESRAAEQQHDFEERLVSDPLSPQWAASNEKTIGAFLAAGNLAKQQLPVPKNFQARCHSHLCRISMDFANPDQASQTQAMLLMEIAPSLPNAATFLLPRPDGTVQMLIFAGDPQSIH